jgi:hypothetical protein
MRESRVRASTEQHSEDDGSSDEAFKPSQLMRRSPDKDTENEQIVSEITLDYPLSPLAKAAQELKPIFKIDSVSMSDKETLFESSHPTETQKLIELIKDLQDYKSSYDILCAYFN